MEQQQSQDQIKQQMAALSWYHTIDLGQGLVTPGHYDHRPFLPWYGLPRSLAGKTALDVGPASGFFSFEMEQRGATVTAIDLPSWESHDFGPRYTPDMDAAAAEHYLHSPFLFAKQVLHSKAERRELNVYDLSPQSLGSFDFVFCGSVLLHLSDPIRALWRIASVTREVAIIATVIRNAPDSEPLAAFVGHQRGDCWWYPNRLALEMMVQAAGFQGWEWFSDFALDYGDGSPGPYHGVVRAWKTPEKPAWLADIEPLPVHTAPPVAPRPQPSWWRRLLGGW